MKPTTTNRLFSMATGLVVFGAALAGTLDPPGPPAPTMVTLQQIYDRLGARASVARTGQTGCWDTFGNPVSCAGTGQDGAFQIGASASPRFTDNGNGTVKDNLTGLVWLKNADCFGQETWATALTSSNTLASGACGLTDGSVAGTWRLPNIKELQSLFDYSQYNPSLPAGHPFAGVDIPAGYWSSTSAAGGEGSAWYARFDEGFMDNFPKYDTKHVWPVRG
ncbi:MAG: DUF1566 domain-containing protein [Acidobacteria bacterium]|nr:DUF1566 domain-containing protein [Acidobacteriota bacterium]